MDKELFDELAESIQWMKAYQRGDAQPGRVFTQCEDGQIVQAWPDPSTDTPCDPPLIEREK